MNSHGPYIVPKRDGRVVLVDPGPILPKVGPSNKITSNPVIQAGRQLSVRASALPILRRPDVADIGTRNQDSE